MKNTITQAYQDKVLFLVRHSLKPFFEEEDTLYAFLTYSWEKFLPKFHLQCIKNHELPPIDAEDTVRKNLFLFAVGLATYGQKHVISFILQEIPKQGNLYQLATILLHVLPLPQNIKTLEKKTEILEWLEIHYDQLTWDEEKEVFYLKEEG